MRRLVYYLECLYNELIIHNMDTTMKNTYVYWIHTTDQTDPETEGYVGITNNLTRRFREHLEGKGNSQVHLHAAMNKYKEHLVFDVLHVTETREEAYELEYAYRPGKNIGWNYAVGGEDAVFEHRKKPVTLYHKDDVNTLRSFDSIEEASRVLDISYPRIQMALYRASNYYGADGWAVLVDSTVDRATTKTVGEARSARLKGVPKRQPSHFKGVTGRWSAEQKAKISAVHKGKKLSEQHIERLREVNRKSANCVPITLVHKDNPDKEYSFHSISEAARQLELPVSRLKSKVQRPLGVYGKDGWKVVRQGSE